MSLGMPKKTFPQDKSIDCLMTSSSHREYMSISSLVPGQSIAPLLVSLFGDKEEHSKSLSGCYMVILMFNLASRMMLNRDQAALGNPVWNN